MSFGMNMVATLRWITVVALFFQTVRASPLSGELDTGFNAVLEDWVRTVVVRPDQSFYIGGAFTNVNGHIRMGVARFRADGSLDETFVPALRQIGSVYTIVPRNDGKLFVAGFFQRPTTNTDSRTHVALLNHNGTVDQHFDPPDIVGFVRQLLELPDGKILIAGDISFMAGRASTDIVRLHPNGAIDSTFNPGSGPNGLVRWLHRQSSGHILVGGMFTTYNNIARPYLVRIDADGALDTNYSAVVSATVQDSRNGVYFMEPIGSQVYVSGRFDAVSGVPRSSMALLHADGLLDPSFVPAGPISGGEVYFIRRQWNGRLVIGGSFTNVNNTAARRIARLESSGGLDSSFTVGTGFENQTLTGALLQDGRILVAGLFTNYNGSVRTRLARLHGDPTPFLRIERQPNNQFNVRWPVAFSDYQLQNSETLLSPDWHAVDGSPSVSSDSVSVSIEAGETRRLFRLSRP